MRTAAIVALAVAVLFAGVVGVIVIVGNDDRSTDAQALAIRVEVESTVREKQFCQLLLGQQQDRVTRLNNTIEYLRSDVGKLTTGSTGNFNKYIRRISLPQIKDEIAKGEKNLPPVCRKYRRA